MGGEGHIGRFLPEPLTVFPDCATLSSLSGWRQARHPCLQPAGLRRFPVVLAPTYFLLLGSTSGNCLSLFRWNQRERKWCRVSAKEWVSQWAAPVLEMITVVGGVAPAFVIRRVFPAEVSFRRWFFTIRACWDLGDRAAHCHMSHSVRHLPWWSEASPYGS